ncbi:TetR/AcrR family transcriptional regulator [Lederbergia citrea]|uniref:TetR/AcrR family transcriptional regulator n=1 Tax=Lederbergia citrea TaxID=2833581 RepID=UPI001BC8E5EF|nr:TetR/AcrR family transcriptional regulator [Lederbergia citrea]MBS4179063.1 TetR/AcrR family transcriptional regulator [Lederbergia citrea]
MFGITKPFKNLDFAKQKRIINAALKEFTDKGFEQASTNQIVKDAGIGKGMLFYYFNSKKELYYYLIDYCLEITEQKYFELIDTSERDLFERLKKISNVKMEFLMKYPNAINFLATIFLQNFDQMDEELISRVEALQVIGHTKIYGNLDYSMFRDDIDAEKALKLVKWAFHGYEEELKLRLRDHDVTSIDYGPYFDEFFNYLDIMRTCFYKKERPK